MIDNVTPLPTAAARPDFEIGDVVRLNSGGPESTVVRVAGKGKTEVTVAWYDEARALTEASFPPAALRFVEAKK